MCSSIEQSINNFNASNGVECPNDGIQNTNDLSNKHQNYFRKMKQINYRRNSLLNSFGIIKFTEINYYFVQQSNQQNIRIKNVRITLHLSVDCRQTLILNRKPM